MTKMLMKRTVITAFLIFSLHSSFSISQTAEAIYKQAKEAEKKGNLPAAIDLYEEAASLDLDKKNYLNSLRKAKEKLTKAIFKQAEETEKKRDLSAAIDLYEKALSRDPDNKKYRKAVIEAKQAKVAELILTAYPKWPGQPSEVLDLLSEARSLGVEPPKKVRSRNIAKMLTELRKMIEQKRLELLYLTIDYLKKAKSRDFTGGTWTQFYVRNSKFIDLVPEIEEVAVEMRIQKRLQRVEQYLVVFEVDKIAPELRVVLTLDPTHEQALRLSEQISERCEGKMLDSTLALAKRVQAARCVTKVQTISRLDTEVEFKGLRDELEKEYWENFHQITSQITASGTPASYRMAEELALGQNRFVTSSIWITELRNRAHPHLNVSIKLPNLVDSEIRPLLSELQTELENDLSVSSGAPQYQIAVSVDVKRTDLPRVNLQKKQSRYVATRIQKTNPRYIQLQQELQQALIELSIKEAERDASPTNFGTAFLVGWAQGKVLSLQEQLVQTSPFFEEPVIQPYEYTTFQSRREISATFTGLLTDAASTELDKVDSTVQIESVGEGIEGALPQDQTRIENKEPKLASFGEMLLKLQQDLRVTAKEAMHKLLSSAFLDLASKAYSQEQAVEVMGNLLFASDFLPKEEASELKALWADDDILFNRLPELSTFSSLVDEYRVKVDGSKDVPSLNATELVTRVIPALVAIETDEKTGSGFIVDNNGTIVTNSHVISGASRIKVRTQSGDIFLGSVIREDPSKDLALLRISATTPTYLKLADITSVEVGEDVFAFGNPLGLEGTVTRGIVSAIRNIDGTRFLQIDAPINPGNSGGPVVNTKGVVVGVVTSKIGEEYESLGFAVSVDVLQSFIDGHMP